MRNFKVFHWFVVGISLQQLSLCIKLLKFWAFWILYLYSVSNVNISIILLAYQFYLWLVVFRKLI